MADYEVGAVYVDVEPDASGFRKKAMAEVKVAADGIEANVEVVPNTRGLAAALRRQIKEVMAASNINIEVPVSLKIDQSRLRTDLRLLQERVNAQNVTLNLGVNVSKTTLQTELRRVREVIKAEKDLEINLKPTILRRDVQEAIRELKAFARAEGAELPLRPALSANKGAFIAEVRAFIREVELSLPTINVSVKADTKSIGATSAAIGAIGSAKNTKGLKELDDHLVSLVKSSGAIVGPLGGAGAQFARLTQSGSLAAAAIGGLGVAFAGIIGYGAKLAADAQLANQGISALAENAGLSTQETKGFIKQLEQFAAVTPFEVPEVKGATKFLLGAGTALEDVLPTLRRITDVGSVLGSTTENIENVANAMAKLKGRGTAQLLELNQIRRNLPGFNPVQAIADFKGQDIATTFDQISKKAIPADLAIAAINQGLADFPGAAGAAGRAAETLSGRFATLKDNVAIGFQNAFLDPKVEKPLNDLLKSLTINAEAQITDLARSLTPVITAFGPALQSGIQFFIELTRAAAPFYTILLEAGTALTTSLTPSLQNLREPLEAFGQLLGAVAPLLGSVIGLIISGLSPFGALSGVFGALGTGIEALADTLNMLPGPIQTVLGLIILLNRQALFSGLVSAGPAILGVFTRMTGAVVDLAITHFPALTGAIAKGVAGVQNFLGAIGPIGLAAAGVAVLLVIRYFQVAKRAADEARLSGEQFGETISALVNDTSKAKFDLSEAYAIRLGDPSTPLGKIFDSGPFKEALADRNESVATYAERLSKDSKSANRAYFDLATDADKFKGIGGTLAKSFGDGFGLVANDMEDGLDRIASAQKSYVDLLASSSGQGSDIIKKTLKSTQDELLAQGKFQYEATVENGKLVQVANKDLADYNLTTQITGQKLKDLGISYDFTTGKISVFDQATTDLANALNISLDATDEFAKQIDALGESVTTLFDSIAGRDTFKAYVEDLGGASLAITDIINSGSDLTAGLTGLTIEMGLTGEAAAEFIQNALKFGTAYTEEISKTQEAFKGLIPTVGGVFDELKEKAEGVLPSYDTLLEGLQKKLEESALINENIGQIISRGGTGVIEILKQLPAEAQAQYAAAIAAADDKTFVTLEAKSRELNAEGIAQIQNQGLLSIATVQQTTQSTLAPIAAAQAALAAKATDDTNFLTGLKSALNPVKDDGTNFFTGLKNALAPAKADITTAVGQVNEQLSTIPPAAKAASDQAAASLSPLPGKIIAATIPGLQSWADQTSSVMDEIVGSFNRLAIQSVGSVQQMALALGPIIDSIGGSFDGLIIRMGDAMNSLANSLEAPANRVLAIVGSMADAINSVINQVGGAGKITVPNVVVPRSGARVGKVEVRHSGGVVGVDPSGVRGLNGPLAPNEQMVLAQKGEGVIPVDAMKKLGLEQFKFIQKGNLEGLLAAKSKIPGSKTQVAGANSLMPGAADGMGQAIGGAMLLAVGNLTKNVDKYLTEISTLIDAKIGSLPGLISPTGPGGSGNFGSGSAAAAGWIRQAMAITGVPESWFVGLMTLAKRESGFNPRAINLWDSNAAKGIPSKGLMQTIEPTFRGNALPGYGDIYNPVHNAIASIRYILRRYGDISRVQQANPNKAPKGYELGGLLDQEQLIRIAERNKPELVIPLTNAKRSEELLAKYLFDPTVSSVDPGRMLDSLEAAAGRRLGTQQKSAPDIMVGQGGSLITIQAEAQSVEALEAQLLGRAGPLVRQLLSL